MSAAVVVRTLLLLAICLAVHAALVPGRGEHDASCVHRVPSGSLIVRHADHSHTVQQPNGKLVHYPACKTVPHVDRHGVAWKAYTQILSNTTPVNFFTGLWTVPTVPVNVEQQTLFFWNGVEDIGNTEVIQPVLQFGSSAAGGGNYWAIASWYVGPSVFFSELLTVNTNDVINGTMVDNLATSTWGVNAVVVSSGQNSTLFYKHPKPTEQYAYCVLEAYTITDCTEYPQKQTAVVFSKLAISTQKGPITPKWQALQQQPITCNEHATIQNAGEVTINFQDVDA
jgi:hypothetical protein